MQINSKCEEINLEKNFSSMISLSRRKNPTICNAFFNTFCVRIFKLKIGIRNLNFTYMLKKGSNFIFLYFIDALN